MADQKSERVHMLLSPEDLRAIDLWAKESGSRSRTEAIRRLLRLGMLATESAETLAQRCSDAVLQKKSISWIVENYLEGHPRITRASFGVGDIEIEFADEVRIVIDKYGKWQLYPITRPEE